MNLKPETNVGGLNFDWDLESGKFQFEGEDAVLFWISSAMRMFFDTIEEVSGEEAANVVLETTGFRQGLIVGEYFQNLKMVSVEEAANLITNTYASAGWGRVFIENLDFEIKSFNLKLKDDWEYKVGVAQQKRTGGTFLPAHYAGIFTGLFHTNIWYEVVEYQIEGHEYTKVNYFPSSITVTENIHQLARKREVKEIQMLEGLVEDKTRELQKLVQTLSAPMIPVLDDIVVVPLLGKYDEKRAEELIEKTLSMLPKHEASYLLLDLTGIDKDFSSFAASMVEKLVSATYLIGTKTILVGISNELSLRMTQNNVDFSNLDCFRTLQHGIYFALSQSGRRIENSY
ncbi:STAS domain-containing protein [Evansella sp. AB-rgal1]|uniref:STAS domain-containing protein n=1 Tax=Evansella sp. AB-rgal1 TaxID=3242696 RepID=UPI00359D244D